MDAEGMPRRIGATHEGPPTVERLRRLHTAYVDQMPYETVQYDLRLRRSKQVGGWWLDQDPGSGLVGLDFESAVVQLDAFEEQHAYLSNRFLAKGFGIS